MKKWKNTGSAQLWCLSRYPTLVFCPVGCNMEKWNLGNIFPIVYWGPGRDSFSSPRPPRRRPGSWRPCRATCPRPASWRGRRARGRAWGSSSPARRCRSRGRRGRGRGSCRRRGRRASRSCAEFLKTCNHRFKDGSCRRKEVSVTF